MRISRLRAGLSTVLLVAVCAVIGNEVKENFWPDRTPSGQIRKLNDYWAFKRKAAATELASFVADAPTVVPALVGALKDPSPEVRLRAIESLRVLSQSSASFAGELGPVIKDDSDPRVRQAAVALLGSLHEKAQIGPLIAAINDSVPAVRQEALKALARQGASIADGPAVDALIEVIRHDRSDEIRETAVEAIEAIAPENERVATTVAEALANDQSARVRCKSLALMQNSRFAFEIPAIIKAVDDQSPQVRLAAVASLSALGMADDRTIPAICRAARNADDMTREGIALSINLLSLHWPEKKPPEDQLRKRYQTAVAEFRTVLETPAAAAREQVIDLLTRLVALYTKSREPALFEPAQAAAEALLSRMADEKEEAALRLHVMNQWRAINLAEPVVSPGSTALDTADQPAKPGEFHPSRMWIVAMSSVLASKSPEIRARAIEILMGVFQDSGSDPSVRDGWRKLVPVLGDSIKSGDKRVCLGALGLLTMLGPQAIDALPAVRSLGRSSRDPDIQSAVEQASLSIRSVDELKSKVRDDRIAAAARLGRLGWPAVPAIPGLIGLLKDSSETVRIAAASALQSLGSVGLPAVPELAKALGAESLPGVRAALLDAIEAVAPGTPAALDAHRIGLRDPDPKVRAAATTFKVPPTDDPTVLALGSVITDSSDEIRRKAVDVLGEIVLQNPQVIPTLLKTLGDLPASGRAPVIEALDRHLVRPAATAGMPAATAAAPPRRGRANLAAIRATVAAAVPALKEAMSSTDPDLRILVFKLLGKIAELARTTRDDELRKGAEGALDLYLTGLEGADAALQKEILGRMDALPVDRAPVIAALQKFVDRPDLTAEDRAAAARALTKAHTATSQPASGAHL